MKPRVLFSDGHIRVVRGKWFFFAEQASGQDKLGRTRWVDIADPMRKARRAGK